MSARARTHLWRAPGDSDAIFGHVAKLGLVFKQSRKCQIPISYHTGHHRNDFRTSRLGPAPLLEGIEMDRLSAELAKDSEAIVMPTKSGSRLLFKRDNDAALQGL